MQMLLRTWNIIFLWWLSLGNYDDLFSVAWSLLNSFKYRGWSSSIQNAANKKSQKFRLQQESQHTLIQTHWSFSQKTCVSTVNKPFSIPRHGRGPLWVIMISKMSIITPPRYKISVKWNKWDTGCKRAL